jgi:DNA replication protein DnaC
LEQPSISTAQEYSLKAGVGKRYLNAKISDFPDIIKNKIKSAVEGKKSIFIYGPRGTGKTHLLAAIANRFSEMKTGPSFDFISVPDMLLEIRKDMDASAKKILEYSGQRGIWYDSPLDILFLDDLGTEKLTDWALSTIYTVIDGRYRNCFLTFISSNYTLDEIADRVDDRISSRLAEMCEIIHLTGKDRRVNPKTPGLA